MSETKQRIQTQIDYESGAVTVGDAFYKLATLDPRTINSLALRGLRQDLRTADDPAATWSNLLNGKVAAKTAAKPLQLDSWREAAARVRAESVVKATGFRAPPRTKLVDTAEFKLALDDARQVVSGWDKAMLLRAKKVPDIQRAHADLAGDAVSVDELFAGASSTDVALDQAAD